ncbi:MAG: recombinase family protein, partial [Bacteroidales bacterium]|nr:recombinase family protein [Bacteroidales bacterium]
RRVSTDGQGDSGLGLDTQEAIILANMQREPVQMFTEVYSGTKLKQCKELWEAINLCKQNGYLLVVASYDRFRNVSEALEVVDSIGERNILFCDLPSSDRFVLTIMFAVAEKQAKMIQLKTKLALDERKKQIERDGGFFSKSGNWCTHLGGKKGDDLSKARAAAAAVANKKSSDWRDSSPLYSWAQIQYYKKRSRKEILEEAEKLFQKSPEIYCTRQGKMLTKGILSVWVREWQMS